MELSDYIPKGDDSVRQRAEGFLQYRDGSYPNFNPEGVCFYFRRAFGKEGPNKAHPEVEEAMVSLRNFGRINSKNAPLDQSIAMYAALERMTLLINNTEYAYLGNSEGRIHVINPSVARQDWPKFWDFLRDSQGI